MQIRNRFFLGFERNFVWINKKISRYCSSYRASCKIYVSANTWKHTCLYVVLCLSCYSLYHLLRIKEICAAMYISKCSVPSVESYPSLPLSSLALYGQPYIVRIGSACTVYGLLFVPMAAFVSAATSFGVFSVLGQTFSIFLLVLFL